MKTPSNSFCVMPFGHLFLSEEGKSLPCCYALEARAVNCTADGSPILVRDSESLELAWNSPTQRAVRRQMLQGEKPEACRRCFGLEDHGLQSLREVFNQRFLPDALPLMATLTPDGSMAQNFFSVDIRLGNQCNLRCQMCSPISSRKLAQDFQRIYPNSGVDFTQQAEINWHKAPFLLDNLFTHIGSLKEIHFAGGEPFLIPEVYQVVEFLSNRPEAGVITLSFNTNGTILPEKLIRLFSKFKTVRLIISVDGLSEVNNYIRFPSLFSSIEKNLQTLHDNRITWNISLVALNVTVQIHNIFHLPTLINFVGENYPDFWPFPLLGPLNVPECLSIKVLPASAKGMARDRIEAFISDSQPTWKNWEKRINEKWAEKFNIQIKGLLDFMDSEDRSDLLPEFYRFTGVIEQIRGQKLAVPGL